ncbi:MAG: sulfite exporter TauE/SafE family protein, partial [Candidatus Zixiibacteriota bacterium]
HGGFIQAGVGIFLLAGLVLSAGYDLVRANAVKLLIVLCFTPIALAVFIYNGHVQWYAGLILGIGNMLGAWVASRMAVKRGAIFARWVLIAVLIIASAALLGVRDVIGL